MKRVIRIILLQNLSRSVENLTSNEKEHVFMRWRMGEEYILLTRGKWRPAKIRKTCERKVQSFWKNSLVWFLIIVVSVNFKSLLWVWHIYCTCVKSPYVPVKRGTFKLGSLLLSTFPIRTSNTILLSLLKLTYDANSKNICFIVRKWKWRLSYICLSRLRCFQVVKQRYLDTNLTSFFDCITPVIDR